MTTLRLLVVDAYDAAGRASLARVGATPAGTIYRDLLEGWEPEATVDVTTFDGAFALPESVGIGDYHGMVWTGSNLSIHEDTPATREHLALARAAFEAGTAAFGSCWGLQVAVTATGGACAPNPRGREFGIARAIIQTPAGRAHPMFRGRSIAFDAPTSHEDHVTQVGMSTTILAGNAWSAVQAVAIKQAAGLFWGVQYHPEFSLHDIARLCVLRAPQLIRQGFFRDDADVSRWVDAAEALHADPARTDLAFLLGLGPDLLDPVQRTAEIRRWLDVAVKERLEI